MILDVDHQPECGTVAWDEACLSIYNGCLVGEDYHGCAYPSATDYSPYVEIDDGSCTFPWSFCYGDANGDQVINTADLAALLGEFGNTCPF